MNGDPNSVSILIVEDDPQLREALVDTLELSNFDCVAVENGQVAIDYLKKQSVDMVVSDVNMPIMDGHKLLQTLREFFPGLPVILMTAYGTIDKAVDAMQLGAADYLVKPFNADTLVDHIQNYFNQVVNQDDEPVAIESSSKRVFQLAQKVADTDTTILVSGESGTGKEVLARFIHRHSNRSSSPFVAINCAAIPENMLESTLFGYEKGAFTGAYSSSPGKFEQANGGTLLLDEISEMDLGLQAKLLRVLQEREVERIGGKKTIELDVRVIATTNRNLLSYVREGKFREDLYYRLNVFPLEWQPLRNRRKDIIPIGEKLLSKYCLKMGKPQLTFDELAKKSLLNHNWPGNVRELDNAIQRALILQEGKFITAADLSLHLSPEPVTDNTTANLNHLNQENNYLGSLSVAMPAGERATHTVIESNSMASDSMNPDTDLSRLEIEDKVLGSDLRKREFELIVQAIKTEKSRKDAADKLGISPRTLRYKIAKMREQGLDVDEAVVI